MATNEVWIDASVIQSAATSLGLTFDQALAWYAANRETVRLVRDYVARVKSPTPEDVEANANPHGPINAELVAQVGALLEAGGLIVRMSAT